MASKENKTITIMWKLEIMTPLGNINLNKIFEKIVSMFMKQRYGHAFQPIKGCFALTSISVTNLRNKYPILQHMDKEKKQMCQSSCLVGFLFDRRSLKIGALMWREFSHVTGL